MSRLYDGPVSEDQYEKRQKLIRKAISKAAKKSGTEILKESVKEMDVEAKEKTRAHCEMARMLFNEGLEMYEEGDMSFEDFVEDLHKTLKAIQDTDEDVDKLKDKD